MFTKFICQNDFRPLSTFIRGAVAYCGLAVAV